MKYITTLFLVFLFFGMGQSNAQQMVYTPVNTNFGGNYLNYSGLLASAEAQNPFKEKDSYTMNNSLLDTFSETVKRQILNQFSSGLFGSGMNGGMGGGNLEPGTTQIGGLVINIERARGGSIISIIDTDTGESTEILL